MKQIKNNMLLSMCLVVLFSLQSFSWVMAHSNEGRVVVTGDLVSPQEKNYSEESENLQETNQPEDQQKETVKKIPMTTNQRRLPKTNEHLNFSWIGLGFVIILGSVWKLFSVKVKHQ